MVIVTVIVMVIIAVIVAVRVAVRGVVGPGIVRGSAVGVSGCVVVRGHRRHGSGPRGGRPNVCGTDQGAGGAGGTTGFISTPAATSAVEMSCRRARSTFHCAPGRVVTTTRRVTP